MFIDTVPYDSALTSEIAVQRMEADDRYQAARLFYLEARCKFDTARHAYDEGLIGWGKVAKLLDLAEDARDGVKAAREALDRIPDITI